MELERSFPKQSTLVQKRICTGDTTGQESSDVIGNLWM